MKKSLFMLPCIALFLLMIVNSPSAFAFAFQSFSHSSRVIPFNKIEYRPVHACNRAPAIGFVRCLAIIMQPIGVQAQSAKYIPPGLTPSDLQNAYKLPSTKAGSGQTVAIIDAYDDPNAEKDLAVYRSTFRLPPCTTRNGCFKKVDETGGNHYPQADSAWAGEISLDLDMVSAIAPNSHILLVEGNNASFADLGKGVDTAVRLGAKEISNSYGGNEDPYDANYVMQYYDHPGVAITASSGDGGYGVQLPAAFSSVISVGGTSLSKARNARGWNESAWRYAGSGCSVYISKPQWQKDSGCKKRSVADVSAVADPITGVIVYNTYQSMGTWFIYGGTSASSPIIASVFALAGNTTRINGSFLYSHSSHLNDVTSGRNGTCKPTYLCTSVKGYDGPTGLGTPNGIGAF